MGAIALTNTLPAVGRRTRSESYEALIQRLSDQSVKKHFDAYEDIDWEAPENELRADDPRFELSVETSLGATQWYRAQPQAVRASIGLHLTASSMKTGIAFENVLQRGLLEYCSTVPNRSVEYRYAMHEVIEEGQHSLMFQEFINRSGFDPRGLTGAVARAARRVVTFGRIFPELFFLFVLGGEEPIDFAQKRDLKSGRMKHPLAKRISQIHITEEARHLCFARQYLERNVPKLPYWKKAVLAVVTPFILSEMAKQMLQPSDAIVERYDIPASVIREAYTDNTDHRAAVRESLSGVQRLCKRLRLTDGPIPLLWRVLRLGNPNSPALAA